MKNSENSNNKSTSKNDNESEIMKNDNLEHFKYEVAQELGISHRRNKNSRQTK